LACVLALLAPALGCTRAPRGGGSGSQATPSPARTGPVEPGSCGAGGSFADGPLFVYARANHTALLLRDGRILLSGGAHNLHVEAGPEVEIFDPDGKRNGDALGLPDSDAVRLTDGRLLVLPGSHTARSFVLDLTSMEKSSAGDAPMLESPVLTLLADGSVLATGVVNTDREGAARLVPATMSWELLPVPDRKATGWHTATLLPNGRVAIVRGSGSMDVLTPQPFGYRALTAQGAAREGGAAVGLADGRVLLVMGCKNAACTGAAPPELFDPATQRMVTLAGEDRRGGTATLLTDGRVLLAGGAGPDGKPLLAATVFDPRHNRLCPAATMRDGHVWGAAVRLDDGRVIITGGATQWELAMDQYIRATEIFNP
jgi:hypothetical protein